MNQPQNDVVLVKDVAQGAPIAEPPAKKKKKVSLTQRKARSGWLFVLPFVVGLLVLYIPIILDSICFSFFEIIPTTSGYSLQFQGIKFYHQALFVTTSFTTTLVSGIKQLLVDTPMILIFSLFIAVVLNQKMV